MPVFGVLFFRWINPDTAPSLLGSAHHLPELYFWQKTSAKDVCLFAGREVTHRLHPGDAKSLKYKEYLCHARIVTVDDVHIACVVMTDEQYPGRVVNTFIVKALDRFLEAHSLKEISQYRDKDVSLPCVGVEELLAAYQKPEEADTIMRLEKQLDETKETLVDTLDVLLRRGERLEDLSERSADLSYKSKAFLRNTEAMNAWCPQGCILF